MATGRDLALAGTDVLDIGANEPGMGGSPPDVNPLHKIHMLLKGRYPWAIGLTIAGMLIGGTVGLLVGHPIYISNGWVHVQPVMPKVLNGDEGGVMPFFDSFADEQISVMQSQRVLDNALQSETWRATGQPTGPDEVEELNKAILIVRPKGSEVIQISMTDPKPAVAQAAVKAILEAYQKINSERNTESDEKVQDVLQNAMTISQSDLAAKRQQIIDLARGYGTDDLQKMYDAEFDEVNKEKALLSDMQLALASMAPARPGPATRKSQDISELGVEDIALRDPSMAELLKQRSQIQMRMAGLEQQGILPNHRIMIGARSDLAELDKQIQARADQYKKMIADGDLPSTPSTGNGNLGAAGVNTQMLQARIAAVQKLYDQKHQDLLILGQKRLDIDNLRKEEDSIKERVDVFKARIEQLNLQDKVSGRIQIVSFGDRPVVQKDTRLKIAPGCAFGGGVLGFGIVLLIGLMDRRFHSPEELRSSVTGGPVLGVLPELPDDLSDPEQAALTAHFVHQIRTLLQIWDSGVGTQVFSITSPVAGTGKTSLTLALGVSFAAADSKTLLIDCDLIGGGLTSRANAIVKRKIGRILQREGLLTDRQLDEALKLASGSRRRLGEILLELGYLKESDLDSALVTQQKGNVGLLDAINGENLDDCVSESGIPGLHILPLGSATSQHASKVTPQALRRLLAEARKRYDTILIDSGPVPGSLEASVAATEVDGVILCVSRGEQRPLADKAIKHLVSLGAKVAGVVFNRAKTTDMTLYGTAVRTSMSPTSVPQQGADSARFGPMAQAVTYSGSANAEETPGPATTESDKK
ncbi:MAG TPA: hypothetical protein VFE58_04950 [Tepidisphaeraceae bacterium]|jgi:Mrp family chromosome partitioning ATPase|nr:hypothetical protein [Tepidisphaeraceae bacterium]